MAINRPSLWIDNGEKYALVGLQVNLADDVLQGQIAPDLWALTGRFDFPDDWREWLGTIRSEHVESCNLFLMSKLASRQPEVLDGENQKLSHLVTLFYLGLLLASPFSPAEKPVTLTGTRLKGGEMSLRQVGDLETPVPREFHSYPEVCAEQIETAARLALKLREIETTQIEGGRWRFFRVLHLYYETRTESDLFERIHQYARCIDGLILPDAGKTRQQFKSRTELFIGPRHHELMGLIYDVRSAVEHLHANQYLETFERNERLEILRKEAVVEYIARSALSRIVGNPALFPHFANARALSTFWSMDQSERQRIWGDAIDPADALEEFDPRYISDAMLGKQ